MTHISINDRVPTLDFTPHALKDGIGIVELVLMAGFADTALVARDLVSNGAVFVDDKQIIDPDHHILSYAFDDGDVLRLSAAAHGSIMVRRLG
ncbi:tyrosyl-tRNA synthetase [Thalassospira sp. MA62]|nr:tyrosyl-tRNA synthetase [Thalassospira sp. MA62]